MNTIRCSILIPTKNGELWIRKCLDAVFSQKGAGTFEVIIIDSGSTDATLQLLSCYQVLIKKIPAASFHHARTRNYAASLASGEFLIFLSQDAIPATDNWLKSMVENFENSGVGAVYGRQLPTANSEAERSDVLSVMYGDVRIVKNQSTQKSLGYRYYSFSDANSAIRKSVWQMTGFPENLKVFEDLGIAKRILDAGCTIIYEPNASVYHSHTHTYVGLMKRYFDIGFTYRRLGIWNLRILPSMLRDFVKLLIGKVNRPANVAIRSDGQTVFQNLAKSAGLLLGLSESCLPLFFKRHLSAHKVFD